MEILHAVAAFGEAQPTYEQLAEATGRSVRTVQTVVTEARSRGLLSGPALRLGSAWGYVLGIGLGSESCRAGLVDANGVVSVTSELDRMPDQRRLSPAELVGRVSQAAQAVLDQAPAEARRSLLAVATAWPAPVRGSFRPAGAVLDAGWLSTRQPNLREAVARTLGLPVERSHALNDANAHAMAVAFDDARDARVRELNDASAAAAGTWRISLSVRIGGGIGAASMLLAPPDSSRSAFLRSIMLGGARSLAGEIAHLPVDAAVLDEMEERRKWVGGLAPIDPTRRCSCGRTGHLEALASGDALVARLVESGFTRNEVFAAFDAASHDEDLDLEDQRIQAALEDAGRLVGRSLTAPVLLLDPHVLTLSGSLGVKPVVRGIEAERETWRHVFGDALKIRTVDPGRRRTLGVRGAALAVIRAKVLRRLDDLVASADEMNDLVTAL